MINRRQFLKLGAAVGLGLAAPTSLRQSAFRRSASAFGITNRFVDPLVIPPILAPLPYTIKGATAYTVYASQALHAFSQDPGNEPLHNVPAWAYSPYPAPTRFVDAADFHYLGPTIEAYYLEKVSLEVVNQLPSSHMFSIDHALHGPDHYTDEMPRIITHLHGGKVAPEADGYPEDYYAPGETLRVDYPNKQRAANIWYHDHSLGITRLNVAAGLAAFYFIRDDFEMSLGLPGGPDSPYELPLVIQDRRFVEGGPYGAKLYYLPEWEEEFFAETIVVNGRIWPYHDVEPRKYRLRLLNGSNARTYRLWLEDESGATIPWTQIGNSGGLLPAAIVNAGEITLAPAERADVIVDFAGLNPQTITMKNNAGAPFFNKGTTLDYIAEVTGEDVIDDLRDIMQFNVTLPLAGTDTSTSPAGPILLLDPIPPTAVTDVRDFVFEPQEEEFDYPLIPDWEMHFPIPKGFRLVIHSMQEGWYQNYLNDIANDVANGTELADWRNYSIGFMWDHIPDQVQRGSKCQWTFWNITADMHPLHVHLVNFEVNMRQVLAGNGKLPILNGDAGAPAADNDEDDPPYIVSPTGIDANELGTRDTVKMYPGHATTILFQAREFTGLYPFHCHIIDHEDHEMMRQYQIVTGNPKNKK